MYQVLYRKWRPKTFDDISGQEHVTETLKRQNALNKLSHAYLFTGTRGTGKTSCARILARAVNCENPSDGNPCNNCPSCLGIENGSIMDVTEMDAASNNGVDHVRALREEAVYLPAAVKKRVYIIDEVHMLSTAAFNALLKTLEEPPEHLMFILATTELHKVPATILSRCQKYAFKRALPHVIESLLEYIAGQEKLEITKDALKLIADLADGSFRDALSLLEQCASGTLIDGEYVRRSIGLAGSNEICALLEDILRSEAFKALSRLDALYLNGRDLSAVLGQLCALCRDILLCRLSPPDGGGLLSGYFAGMDFVAFSSLASSARLLDVMGTLQKTLYELDRSADRKAFSELCILKLCEGSFGEPETAREVKRNLPDKAAAKEKSQVSDSLKHAAADAEPKPVSTVAAQELIKEPEISWQAVLNTLSKTMDEFLLGILSDSSHIEAQLDETALKLVAKSPFSMGLINKKEVKDAVKSAVDSLSGRSFNITVEEAGQQESGKKSKLEKLSRFENIVFE